MEEDPFKNIEQENIRLLRECLDVIYGHPDYSTMGHGTHEETAKKLLLEGLSTKPGTTLTETVIPIFDSSKSYTEQSDDEFLKILHWPHKDYKYIVIVMIPNPKEGQRGGMDYFNSVLEDQIHEKWGERNVIPSKFIKGYIDVNNLQFTENDLYDKDAVVVTKDFFAQRPQKSFNKDKPQIPSPPENQQESNENVW